MIFDSNGRRSISKRTPAELSFRSRFPARMSDPNFREMYDVRSARYISSFIRNRSDRTSAKRGNTPHVGVIGVAKIRRM